MCCFNVFAGCGCDLLYVVEWLLIMRVVLCLCVCVVTIVMMGGFVCMVCNSSCDVVWFVCALCVCACVCDSYVCVMCS